ncbi:AraC family transcriptional regulator [Raoultella ornithinolytica]|jgi:AraC-like DNA-binding protein|uniref:AraC family transcriptional regulator n=1 Tax=Raoultella TaxID=160674 RepID=UPI0005C98FF9|nr:MULTISPECIES: AraC family transcriptional regulator [Raoultella]HDX8332442.1 AraC family transcriptional regulator [Raoultella ornithinolytica CD1_MRS_4]ANZ04111.1 AraC family transcriptional regulator [Raoultella ornithinolytica]AOO57875.1 AraC family transcriptional regulator [Raoultella ornithinolytica]APB04009.1 AraC family transcriptional regulator [Raoultella ornithinolytica]ASI57948.1 AraC family transcriptional regulator [Raoultella ornithinolytica]
MQGVPEQFNDERDSARFRHPAQLPGVELYHAHISRYAFEPHTHEAFGIGAIELGAERFRYRGSQYVAPVNSIVTMNPDELHTGEAATADGWRYRMVYLEPQMLEEVTGVRHWWFREVVRQDPQRSQRLCQLIYGLWHTDDPLAQQGLLLDVIDTFRPLAHHAPVIAEATHRFERVRDYLHDNYMHAVSLDELAQVASLSPYHFQRQFKAHFHVTPHQMLMAIRLWRAKAFLTHGMPAAEVAAASGLTDQSHLTRAFTRRYGITPVRYQKQVARR